MKQTTCWKGSHRRLNLLVSAGVVLGLASWTYGQCKNACGAGDVAEGEPCLVDGDNDTTPGATRLRKIPSCSAMANAASPSAARHPPTS